MDSMRHLSTSLPPPSRRRRTEQPQELLADFKAAARSATNLYQTAVAAQAKAYSAGYQDALDELLVFLDSENLGLMDGEGWSVRQWATARLDPDVAPRPADSDSSDDDDGTRGEPADDIRSSSPDAQRRVASEPPQHRQIPPAAPPSLSDFAFRSPLSYPIPQDRDAISRNPSVTNNNSTMELDASGPTNTETVRIITRPSRLRHGSHQPHNRPLAPNTSTINLNLSSGAGSKRKIAYPDFFDISGVSFDQTERKDCGPRGGKRGRHT